MARLAAKEEAAYEPTRTSKSIGYPSREAALALSKSEAATRYDTADLDRWIEVNKRASTSDDPTLRPKHGTS
jgi:hypothetical protein